SGRSAKLIRISITGSVSGLMISSLARGLTCRMATYCLCSQRNVKSQLLFAKTAITPSGWSKSAALKSLQTLHGIPVIRVEFERSLIARDGLRSVATLLECFRKAVVGVA